MYRKQLFAVHNRQNHTTALSKRQGRYFLLGFASLKTNGHIH